jgi:hypothetical protein
MNIVTTLRVLVLFALALVGCAVPAADEATSSIDGLRLVTNDPNRVTGTISRDGASLAFDLVASGTNREASFWSAEGAPLLHSVLRDGIDSMDVLGDRFHVVGSPASATPEVRGDESALREMGARPEMKLVPALREALSEAGVRRDLYSAVDAAGELRVAAYRRADGFWVLSPGESMTFPTWSFWGKTTVIVQNLSSLAYANIELTTWNWYQRYVVVPGGASITWGYWMGVALNVKNLSWYPTDVPQGFSPPPVAIRVI